jgi:hypothetical protein
MADPTNFRRERIEKLLYELRYEVERGMLEREIDETITFGFFVPISQSIPDGVVKCEFRTRPVPRYYAVGEACEPRLRLVKSEIAKKLT